jgi:hypothetical protein
MRLGGVLGQRIKGVAKGDAWVHSVDWRRNEKKREITAGEAKSTGAEAKSPK